MTPFYETMKAGYAALWDKMTINPSRADDAGKIVDRLAGSRARYETVSISTGVPWFWVAITHELEASGLFNAHLHNGDSLRRRTVHVPAGRPATGAPPFRWETSAIDALHMHALDKVATWDIPRLLYEWERYNGFGYIRHEINSPYLWSFSNQYHAGKYIADGQWSRSAISSQCGAAVLLKTMLDRGIAVIGGDKPAVTAPAPIRADAPIPAAARPSLFARLWHFFSL